MKLYAEGNIGLDRIAYIFNNEGWAFQDRYGEPRPVNRDDVRRVIGSWMTYGVVVDDGRSKDKAGYLELDVENVPSDKE